jgi:dTMP kinase
MFITFEGIDGCGKSTQVERLRGFLERSGRSVVVAREPGETAIGERIRKLLLDGPEMSPRTEASLFAAARAELVDTVVRPALCRSQIVILDRYIDSSLAYQCFGRGLDFDAVLGWNRFVVGDLEPDLTILLALPAEDATLRVARPRRLFRLERVQGRPDRIERESVEFRRSVEEGYRALLGRFPRRLVEIDATSSRDSIAEQVREHVMHRLAAAPAAEAAATA